MKDIDPKRVKEIFDYDPITGYVTRKIAIARRSKVGERVGYVKPCGYMTASFDGVAYQLHRIAWAVFYGESPKLEIDHINNDKADNRIANLRAASRSENMQNINKPQSNSKVGVRGVSTKRATGKYVAQMNHKGKKIYLGTYASPELAQLAYINAKTKTHPFFNEEAA